MLLLTDIISIAIGIISLILTCLTYKTAAAIKRHIFSSNHKKKLLHNLKNSKRSLLAVQTSISGNLSLELISVQQDIGPCIIALKESKNYLPLSIKKEVSKIIKTYNQIIQNYRLDVNNNAKDLNFELLTFCQQLENAIDKISIKWSSADI